MSTTSDGIAYFYSYFEDAELKFGVPIAVAKKIVDSTKKSIKKKVSLATAIENGEKAIAEAFRKGLHRNEKASKNIAPLIISCCMLSEEALENPGARGFILEISYGSVPSWSADAGEVAGDNAVGGEMKTYAHYRAMAGRNEIDALVAECRAAAMAQTPS
jgi:hypothetical protein